MRRFILRRILRSFEKPELKLLLASGIQWHTYMMDCITLSDFETAARQKLPGMAYDYYSSGANDEITLRENMAAYDRLSLLYRVLVDVSSRKLETTVLGEKISMPVMIAPTAFQCMSDPEGEVATARAAAKANTLMVLSTLATSSMEDVAAAQCNRWFQLYVFKDRGITRELVKRAEAAGYKAIVVTVDLPLSGKRLRDIRNRFKLPEGLMMKNLFPAGLEDLPECVQESGLTSYVAEQFDPSLSWKDLEWFRSTTELPVLVKGIVRADDAKLAVEHGVRGIVVSNHGGRQLDTAPATINALPAIAEAVGDEVEIFVDGGIRRGTDVIKAIALGARAVLIGRPILWGLAAAGEQGVSSVLEIIRAELDLAMALCGCASIEDITSDLVC
jgi:4-hydroxymandelate oxidase